MTAIPVLNKDPKPVPPCFLGTQAPNTGSIIFSAGNPYSHVDEPKSSRWTEATVSRKFPAIRPNSGAISKDSKLLAVATALDEYTFYDIESGEKSTSLKLPRDAYQAEFICGSSTIAFFGETQGVYFSTLSPRYTRHLWKASPDSEHCAPRFWSFSSFRTNFAVADSLGSVHIFTTTNAADVTSWTLQKTIKISDHRLCSGLFFSRTSEDLFTFRDARDGCKAEIVATRSWKGDLRIETRGFEHDGPLTLTRGIDGSVLCTAWQDNTHTLKVIKVEPFGLVCSQMFKNTTPRFSLDMATAGHRRIRAPGRFKNISLVTRRIGSWPGDCLTVLEMGETASGHEFQEMSVNGCYMITDKRLSNGSSEVFLWDIPDRGKTPAPGLGSFLDVKPVEASTREGTPTSYAGSTWDGKYWETEPVQKS